MKKEGYFFPLAAVLTIFAMTAAGLSCKASSPPSQNAQAAKPASADIDAAKIAESAGVPFRIIKSTTAGYSPVFKYYWICVPDRTPSDRIEALLDKVLAAAIEKFPGTYHSYTFHLFYESELTSQPEDCREFATARFLPEGGSTMVGRVPIDDYKGYKLTLSYAKSVK